MLAATLDSSAFGILNGEHANELRIHRNLGKSGKGESKSGKAIVHPNLHHHGYHPHHIGKAGKADTGGKSAKSFDMDHSWTSVGHDDHVGDDGYEWGGDDDGHNMTSLDVMSSVDVLDDDGHNMTAADMDDGWWSGHMHHDHHGKSGKGAKSSKGHKSAKVGKSGKAHKSGKGHHHHHHYDDMHWNWGSLDHTHMPSPAPTPCGKAGKDCPEKPGWLESAIPTPVPTPCGKAGKDCGPPPAPKPKPTPQTLPPICLTIPCSINGVLVSPTDVTGHASEHDATTQPPVPSPIGTTLTTHPPVDDSTAAIITTPPAGAEEPPVRDVVGPPTPTVLVPITVAPSAPSESSYPTWEPTFNPTSAIDYLSSEASSWFQTGKAYEVDSYTRARMGDENDIGFAFAKQEESSSSRPLFSGLISCIGMLIVLLQVV